MKLIALFTIVLTVACKQKSETVVNFHDVRIAIGPTLQYQISNDELVVWDDEKEAGYMKVTRFDIDAESGNMYAVVQQSFKNQADYLDAKLDDAKFLGPPVWVKDEKMDHYGASWRLPDRTMYVLTLTFHQRRLYRFLLRLSDPGALGANRARRQNLVDALENASIVNRSSQ